jgi:hypothetical protein
VRARATVRSVTRYRNVPDRPKTGEVERTRPIYQSVVDLGLRDVGIKNEPRKIAGRLGKAFLALFAFVLVSALALCAVLVRTDADVPVFLVFFLVWLAVGLYLTVRALKRSSPVVVRINAQGTNHATWLVVLPAFLMLAQVLLIGDARLVPLMVVMVVFAVIGWRARGRIPALLRQVRDQLGSTETVLGDGMGVVRKARSRREAFRLIVATDRRLLVASSSSAPGGCVLVDAAYRDITRFGIEWKFGGRTGELSMNVASLDGATDTHVIGNIAPLNLLSIARALESHGVPMDDPELLAEAERAWEEAQEGTAPRPRLLDPAAMSTPEFDHALWLLVVCCGITIYLTPFGGGGPEILVATAVTCLACGYASGTPASIAYLAPLNLLIAPGFFITAAGDVIAVMFALSVIGALCLGAGSALRGAVERRREQPAGRAAGARAEPARGSLRYALSGRSLVRISGGLLAAMLVLVTASSAVGFELRTLKLAVDEATVKQLPVDGRSNLNGNAASLAYTPGPDLHEFITDEDWGAGPNDGARWELRSSFTKGENTISLAHYIFDDPPLDDPAAIAEFVASKDDEHSKIAGFTVEHTRRVVDGRTGYVWTHGNRAGYWHYAVWFPHPVHTIRVECIAKQDERRFKRLCEEALGSLELH